MMDYVEDTTKAGMMLLRKSMRSVNICFSCYCSTVFKKCNTINFKILRNGIQLVFSPKNINLNVIM